jgi:hypothetical protein
VNGFELSRRAAEGAAASGAPGPRRLVVDRARYATPITCGALTPRVPPLVRSSCAAHHRRSRRVCFVFVDRTTGRRTRSNHPRTRDAADSPPPPLPFAAGRRSRLPPPPPPSFASYSFEAPVLRFSLDDAARATAEALRAALVAEQSVATGVGGARARPEVTFAP